MLLCASHTEAVEPTSIASTGEPEPVVAPNRIVRPVELRSTTDKALSLGERLIFHSPKQQQLTAVDVCPADAVINPKTKVWDRLAIDLVVNGDARRVYWRDWPLGNRSNDVLASASADMPVGASVR